MGLLDPKLDKQRTFLLLGRKQAIKAVLTFQGGHDEGAVESIVLTLKTGEEVELPTWYCGGYGMEQRPDGGWDWVPLGQPENEDQELADLLEGPINERFGSWGDVGSTYGTLTWDVFKREVIIDYDQEQPTNVRERMSF